MQTRREVDNMHAALIRSRPIIGIATALATALLAISVAPIGGSTGITPGVEPVAMVYLCPPNC
jgi:hypothetical protein